MLERIFHLCVVSAVLGVCSVSGQVGVYTHHNDNQRTGQNLNETALTPANVNSAQFGKRFSFAVDGEIYAQPLYVPDVNVPGKGVFDVVYVATQHDSVYAFSADGSPIAPLWKVSFINPAAWINTVPSADVGSSDVTPEIGITSTPVIDPATQTLYVVAKTREFFGGATTNLMRLHALDLGTGAEKFGGPVMITASVPGTGAGSVGGVLTFDAKRAHQRPALTLSNGVVYVAFAGHGDQGNYHGWLIGYNAQTLAQTMALNLSPNGIGAGIWQSGGGVAVDQNGNLYVTTGNGSYTADTGGSDYGDTIAKVSPAGQVLDFFTPYNQQSLSNTDQDLGSGGILILPDQPGAHPQLLLSAGKQGTYYLLDRSAMGGYNALTDNVVQRLQSMTAGFFSQPTLWKENIYLGPTGGSLRQHKLVNGVLTTAAL